MLLEYKDSPELDLLYFSIADSNQSEREDKSSHESNEMSQSAYTFAATTDPLKYNLGGTNFTIGNGWDLNFYSQAFNYATINTFKMGMDV